MKKGKRFRRQHGVSFIEIAMIVVIASLVVGSVITYKNFRKAATLRSVITDITRYKSAINDFREKYFAWPGDMTLAFSYWGAECGGPGSTTIGECNGDGNGQISWSAIEGIKAWQHLSLAGLVPQQYDGTCRSSNWANCNGILKFSIPESQVASAGFYIDNPGTLTDNRNVIGIAMEGKFGATGVAVFVPKDAYSIDLKIDDSIANKGGAQALPVQLGPSQVCSKVPAGAVGTDPAAFYSITRPGTECQMFFMIGGL